MRLFFCCLFFPYVVAPFLPNCWHRVFFSIFLFPTLRPAYPCSTVPSICAGRQRRCPFYCRTSGQRPPTTPLPVRPLAAIMWNITTICTTPYIYIYIYIQNLWSTCNHKYICTPIHLTLCTTTSEVLSVTDEQGVSKKFTWFRNLIIWPILVKWSPTQNFMFII